jgi:hypothetical protein
MKALELMNSKKKNYREIIFLLALAAAIEDNNGTV